MELTVVDAASVLKLSYIDLCWWLESKISEISKKENCLLLDSKGIVLDCTPIISS